MDVYQSIVREVMMDLHPMIIPTVMIPLTAVSVVLTMVATFIAGLFGVRLKAEGPRKLLEVLLKPKIMLVALLLSGLIFGGIWAYDYYKNLPSFISTIESKQSDFAKPSEISYENIYRRPVNVQRKSFYDGKSRYELSLEWQSKLPRGLFRAPTLSSGRLFSGSVDGFIYEIDEFSGIIVRKFFVGTFISPASAIYNNTLYVGEGTHYTHHARIYGFDLKTGQLKMTYSTKGHTEGSPVIGSHAGRNLLLAPSGGDGLHAIDLSNMSKFWRAFDGHVDASVYIEGDLVFSGTGREKGDRSKYRSYALAYQFQTGVTVWKNELPASSWMSPVGWKDDICFVYGEVYFPSKLGGLNCYDQRSGKPTKSFNLAYPVTGMPTVVDDHLYITDVAGRVCSLNMKKNQVEWCRSFKSKGRNYASVVYDKDRDILVYATKNKGLKLLAPDSGKTISEWNPASKDGVWSSHFAGAVMVHGGYIIADIKGNVRKIRVNKL